MLCKYGWLLALSGALLFTTPLVQAQTLSVACTDLAGPTAFVDYGTTCIASGGTGPYDWSIVGGQLPAGLSAQGTSSPGPGSVSISGKPTAAGAYSYTVQFTDSQNQIA